MGDRSGGGASLGLALSRSLSGIYPDNKYPEKAERQEPLPEPERYTPTMLPQPRK
jgi:hypothetical protein